MGTKLQLFNEKQISTIWNAEEEEWYFSVVDVVAVLTESDSPRKYWSVLKTRLKAEGSEVTTNCSQLKMLAPDGKNRLRDAMTTKGILRLVQSIPSPKAEPFKMWLAQVGSERLDEIAAPEKAIERAVEYYRKKGYSEAWIKQRMQSINSRNQLTAEWQVRGITDSKDYAILTNDITKAWSGKTVKEYKKFKGLKKESLRDNMTDIELALNMLADVTTTAISKQEKPVTFNESRNVAKRGGKVAKTARDSVEQELGHSVISPLNSTEIELLTTNPKNKSDNKNRPTDRQGD